MNTFLIIILSVIALFTIGSFFTLFFILLHVNPHTHYLLEAMEEADKIAKAAKEAEKISKGTATQLNFKATYDANQVKTAWEGIEAEDKIKRGDTAFKIEKITVRSQSKKAAKKPAKKTKKPVKRTRK